MLGQIAVSADGTVPLALPGSPENYFPDPQPLSPSIGLNDLFRYIYRAAELTVSIQFAGTLNPEAGTGLVSVSGHAQKTCRRSGLFLYTDDPGRPAADPIWKRINFNSFPGIEAVIPSVAIDEFANEISYETRMEISVASGPLASPFFSVRPGFYIIESLSFFLTGLASWDDTDVSGSFLGSSFRLKRSPDTSLFLTRSASVAISLSGGDLPLL